MRLHFIYFCILVFTVPLNGKMTLRLKTVPPEKMEGRVVGGHPVDITQFPSAAIIFNMGGMCSGTVLNSWAVLTAAHCFDHNSEVDYITVHVGARFRIDDNAQVHHVALVEKHKDYNKAMPFACDIALVFVEDQFYFRNIVKKGILVGDESWMNEQHKKFVVYGWGMVNYTGAPSEVGLLMTTMHFIPRDKCGAMHDLTLTPDMFCLYGDGQRDTCKGDSGGGVLWNRLLVGIVSHGDGCALKNKPSVYSNVYYFRSWIRNTIQTYFDRYCRNKIKENKTKN